MRMSASWSGSSRPTEYKVAARNDRARQRVPLDRHPDRAERAVVLEAVKATPAVGQLLRATTIGMSGSGRRNGLPNRAKKRTMKKIAPWRKPLDRISPIQGFSDACITTHPRTPTGGVREAPKARNRGKYGAGGAAGSMGIWPRRASWGWWVGRAGVGGICCWEGWRGWLDEWKEPGGVACPLLWARGYTTPGDRFRPCGGFPGGIEAVRWKGHDSGARARS